MTPPFADAARITPYPFVVHQVPSSPDNADPLRTTKKKRLRSRAERSPQQEEEVRFNTGPVRYGPTRRGSRQGGRSYPDDRNGIPDYPPPSFQEAINTGPLSQSCLSLVPAPMSSIPEDNHDEYPSEPTTRRMEIDPINEVTPVDCTWESDDSALVIINKNEIPVCSTDFPPAKHENKIDWFKRRKQEIPTASTSTIEKSGDVSRGRKLPRITIPINPDPNGMHEQEPMSSPKRRFLSLSPIKTIFPSKPAVQLDRPLSATSSPSSPKFSLGNRNFFRSTHSLTASSLLRLPGSQKKDPLSRRLFTQKGKERATEPVVQENLQDNWEVVEQTAEGERGEAIRPEAENHPKSLMSVVIDSFSANGSTTNFPKNSPKKTRSRSVTPSDGCHSAAPTTSLPNGNSDTISQIPSSRIEPLDGQKSSGQSDQQTTDTPQKSVSPAPLASTPTAPLPQGHPAESVISSRSPTASQSLHASLPVSLRPTVTINPKTTEGNVSQHDLETLLPMTPVYQTNYEHNMPSVIDELKEKLPPPLVPVAVWCSPAASRSIPDLLTDSDHTLPSLHAPSGCSCGTSHNVNASFNSTPSPLGMHMYPSYRAPTPPQFTLLSMASAGEEPWTPSRPHYAGRPLPRPPPIPDVQGMIVDPVLTVNTGPAVGKSNGPSDGIPKEGKTTQGEGLLIDLEDTSLDTNPLSPTTTILSGSDESRFHSQVYLPLMTSPSSSTIFTREPLPTHSSFSPSSIRSTSTVVMPGASCPQHRYQFQRNHRFPYPLSEPNGYSKSNLDLPSRFRDGILDTLQSDLHRHHGYPQDPAGGLGHCYSCEHAVMPWATHPPPSMPVTHGVYQPHYHHPLTMDNPQRQRHHLAHLSY